MRIGNRNHSKFPNRQKESKKKKRHRKERQTPFPLLCSIPSRVVMRMQSCMASDMAQGKVGRVDAPLDTALPNTVTSGGGLNADLFNVLSITTHMPTTSLHRGRSQRPSPPLNSALWHPSRTSQIEVAPRRRSLPCSADSPPHPRRFPGWEAASGPSRRHASSPCTAGVQTASSATETPCCQTTGRPLTPGPSFPSTPWRGYSPRVRVHGRSRARRPQPPPLLPRAALAPYS